MTSASKPSGCTLECGKRSLRNTVVLRIRSRLRDTDTDTIAVSRWSFQISSNARGRDKVFSKTSRVEVTLQQSRECNAPAARMTRAAVNSRPSARRTPTTRSALPDAPMRLTTSQFASRVNPG